MTVTFGCHLPLQRSDVTPEALRTLAQHAEDLGHWTQVKVARQKSRPWRANSRANFASPPARSATRQPQTSPLNGPVAGDSLFRWPEVCSGVPKNGSLRVLAGVVAERSEAESSRWYFKHHASSRIPNIT